MAWIITVPSDLPGAARHVAQDEDGRIARSGNSNSETAAASGMSPEPMPRLNAHVPNRSVVLRGPPYVSTRTMSRFAQVTMMENSTVMAMIFRIIGIVT